MNNIELKARYIFTCKQLELKSGLLIGATDNGLEIGGVDKSVIRNPLTNQPYIPGSSLRGKLRSLLEKKNNLSQNSKIAKVFIHSCETTASYKTCSLCNIFGVKAGEGNFPARVLVRDVPLDLDSAKKLKNMNTDLAYTELKAEVAIDRVTSMASPRLFERVPAGAIFGPAEFIFNIYQDSDLNLIPYWLEGFSLLETDYLGGGGSRGNGKVTFNSWTVSLYDKSIKLDFTDVAELRERISDIQQLYK